MEFDEQPFYFKLMTMAEQVDANQLGIANGACCRVYKTRVKQVVSLHQ